MDEELEFDELHIEGLAADELAELLAEEGADLSDKEAAALQQLVIELGGIDNALRTIEMLGQAEKAA